MRRDEGDAIPVDEATEHDRARLRDMLQVLDELIGADSS